MIIHITIGIFVMLFLVVYLFRTDSLPQLHFLNLDISHYTVVDNHQWKFAQPIFASPSSRPHANLWEALTNINDII